MNRNVTIVAVILVLVVLAGYLVWLRNRFQQPVSPQLGETQEEVVPTPISTPQVSASPSAQVSPSANQKTSTPSSIRR